MKLLIGLLTMAGFLQCHAQVETTLPPSGTPLPGGIFYATIRPGKGGPAREGQSVLFYETMKYPGGKELFALKSPAYPARFRIGANQVVEGVDLGVRGMRTGEIRAITVPPAMSKRQDYPEWLSPDSTIIYEVELVAIEAENLVFQSIDNGDSWQDISNGLPADMHVEDIKMVGNTLWAGSDNTGLYKRTTNGWEKSGAFTLLPNEKVTGIYAAPDGVFASYFRDGFYFSKTGESSWQSAHNRLKDKAVRAVIELSDALLVGADNGIYRSTDHWQTWQQVFAEGQVTSIAESNGVLIAGTWRGIIRSADGGKTWDWVLEDGAAHKTLVLDGKFAVISMFGEVRISDDAGKTWRFINKPVTQPSVVYDLVDAGKYWMMSHEDGIYRSADFGGHWEMVSQQPGNAFIEMDTDGKNIYGGGVICKFKSCPD